MGIPYPGDTALSQKLRSLGCPRPVFECRALLRGAVAARRTPPMGILVRALFGGREPHFRTLGEADQFMAALLGLLEELEASAAARARPAASGRSSKEAGKEAGAGAGGDLVGSLADHAAARYAQVRAFLEGLDLAGTKLDSLDDEGRAALETLTDASAYLGAMSGLCARQGTPSEGPLGDITAAQLGGLETVTADCMQRIEKSLRRAVP